MIGVPVDGYYANEYVQGVKEDNMTHEARYNVRTVKGTPDQSGLTLYEATKALEAAAQFGLLLDATRITRSSCGRDRFVAFFSNWHNEVRAAYPATPQEREVLTMWAA